MAALPPAVKQETEADVAIVGAGPVGLALANLLGAQGVRAVVLERNAGVVNEPRAIAFDDETLRTLQAMGLYEEAAGDMSLDLPVEFRNARGETLMLVDRLPRPCGHSPLGSFYQPHLEGVLARGLERFPRCEPRFGHEVAAISEEVSGVTVEGRQTDGAPFRLRVRYLVGCDGGRSFVRQHLGIPLRGHTYAEKWLVLDTEGDRLERRNVTFHCDPARPTVCVYRSGGRRRWEFLLLPGETEEEMLRPGTIRALLAPHVDPDGITIPRAVVYTFHARTAERYGGGRIWLAGDAAHLMPPFAGQGMNSGIRDALNLGWKLAAVVRGQAPPDLLETYPAERRGHVIKMTRLAVFLGSIIMPTSRLGARLRDFLFALTNRIPAWRAFAREGRFRPAAHVCPSRLVRGGRRSPAGRMLIQPEVVLPDGRRALLDDVLGHGFALLACGRDPAEDPAPADRAWLERLGTAFVRVLPPGSAPPPTDPGTLTVIDETGALAAWLGSRVRHTLIVRPDRFVATTFPPGESAGALAWLRGLIPSGAPGATCSAPPATAGDHGRTAA